MKFRLKEIFYYVRAFAAWALMAKRKREHPGGVPAFLWRDYVFSFGASMIFMRVGSGRGHLPNAFLPMWGIWEGNVT